MWVRPPGYRSSRSFWQSSALAPAVLEEQLRLGLEQAGDTALPVLSLHRGFDAFVRETLPGLPERRWVAHPGPIASSSIASGGPATLLIGPEGGWLDREIAALGAEPLSLGPRTLRTEHAVVALLAHLAAAAAPAR